VKRRIHAQMTDNIHRKANLIDRIIQMAVNPVNDAIHKGLRRAVSRGILDCSRRIVHPCHSVNPRRLRHLARIQPKGFSASSILSYQIRPAPATNSIGYSVNKAHPGSERLDTQGNFNPVLTEKSWGALRICNPSFKPRS